MSSLPHECWTQQPRSSRVEQDTKIYNIIQDLSNNEISQLFFELHSCQKRINCIVQKYKNYVICFPIDEIDDNMNIQIDNTSNIEIYRTIGEAISVLPVFTVKNIELEEIIEKIEQHIKKI